MGLVGGSREYDGAGLGWGPWKCPACAQQNEGPIDAGCIHCGSGSARPYKAAVATPPPTPDLRLTPPVEEAEQPQGFRALRRDMEQGAAILDLAVAWAAAHEGATAIDGFLAGYDLAMRQAQAHTMAAPPVTVDVAALAPEGKARRTIIAALEIFKDQVLRDATEEIASGEWCSIEEVDAIIRQFREEEGPL